MLQPRFRLAFISLLALIQLGCSEKSRLPTGPAPSTLGVSKTPWMPVGSPSTLAVTVLSRNGADLYAGGQLGVWKSSDQGATWSFYSPDPTSAMAWVGNTVFESGMWGFVSSSDDFKTIDRPNGALRVLGAQGNVIYAEIQGYPVARSTDLGRTWIPSSNGLTYGSRVLTFFVRATELLASTYDGALYRSVDGGDDWVRIGGGLTGQAVLSMFDASSALLAGTYAGVYQSSDDGATWSASATGLPTNPTVQAFAAFGPDVYASTSIGLYRSSDAGTSWQAIALPLPEGTSIESLIGGPGGLIAGSAGRGLVRSADGVSWTAGGPRNADVSAVLHLDAEQIVGTTYSGIYRSNDHGATWQLSDRTTDYVYRLVAQGADVFAGTDRGVLRSSDGAAHWVSSNSGVDPYSPIQNLASNGSSLVLSSNGAVYYSSNRGDSWSPGTDLPEGAEINCLTSSNSEFLAGVSAYGHGFGVFKSDDGGAIWVPAYPGMADGTIVTALAASGSDVYAGTWGQGVDRSVNGGAWHATAFTDGKVRELAAHGSSLVAILESGEVRTSPDGGTTWFVAEAGIRSHDGRAVVAGPGEFLLVTSQSIWQQPYTTP